MIDVTAAAREVLQDLITRSLPAGTDGGDGVVREEVGFRLVPAPSPDAEQASLSLALDLPREGDQVVRHADRNVLLVDGATAEALEGRVLDVDEGPEGPVLAVR